MSKKEKTNHFPFLTPNPEQKKKQTHKNQKKIPNQQNPKNQTKQKTNKKLLRSIATNNFLLIPYRLLISALIWKWEQRSNSTALGQHIRR